MLRIDTAGTSPLSKGVRGASVPAAGSCERVRQPGLGNLRKQGSHTGQLLVFIRTSPFRQQDKQYSRSTVVPLPTDDSRAISQAALMGLASIYQPGYRYAKAGVMHLALNDARVD